MLRDPGNAVHGTISHRDEPKDRYWIYSTLYMYYLLSDSKYQCVTKVWNYDTSKSTLFMRLCMFYVAGNLLMYGRLLMCGCAV